MLYVEALVGLGRFQEASGQVEQAIAYFLRALREVPQREDMHRAVMQLYPSQGLPHKATAQYKLLVGLLSRHWKIEPSRETQALYKRVVEAGR